jgi:ABC-type dipeptide/oligopeptide/nickel transport system permease component
VCLNSVDVNHIYRIETHVFVQTLAWLFLPSITLSFSVAASYFASSRAGLVVSVEEYRKLEVIENPSTVPKYQ